MSVCYLEELCPSLPEERELVLMLHNNIYVFTSSVGTQTDTDVFYVNGKPARAVKPFRVILKQEKAQAVVDQAEGSQLGVQISEGRPQAQPQPAEYQQEGIQQDEPQNEDRQQNEEQEEVEEQSEYQVVQAEEQAQPRVLEQPILAAYQPESQARQQLQSQQTQTELRLLHRQLLRFSAGDASP